MAFPQRSTWVPQFNEYLMKYRENGDLERMQRFWFTGACDPTKRHRTSSKPLALAQFMSAFLLLGIGIIFSAFLLLCERSYFGYIRDYMSGVANPPWCNLISLSISESLSFNKGNKKQEAKLPIKEAYSKDRKLLKSEVDGNGKSNINYGETKRHPLSKLVAPQKNNPPISSSSHNQNGTESHNCQDPLCEMNIYTVTKQLDFCNRQIEMLQDALMMKEKSKSHRFILSKSTNDSDGHGRYSSNISESDQFKHVEYIKDKTGQKSIPTTFNKEDFSSTSFIKEDTQSSMRQPLIAPLKIREFIHGGSVAEIETVL